MKIIEVTVICIDGWKGREEINEPVAKTNYLPSQFTFRASYWFIHPLLINKG